MTPNEKISRIISEQYNIYNTRLTEVQPGWSAIAYRVDAGKERYFLKVYDKTRYKSQVWIQGIDHYMPTVVWLGEHTPLRGRIPHVMPPVDSDYKYEDDERVYILFDWIDGITPRDESLTALSSYNHLRGCGENCGKVY